MQYRHIKRLVIAFAFILMVFSLARLYYYLTDDFRLENISYHLPFPMQQQSFYLHPLIPDSLPTIFNQNFYYLKKDKQFYSFLSEDKIYILKFFKFKHIRPHFLANFIPSLPPFRDFKQTNIEGKKNKLFLLFDSLQLSYQQNKKGSGLLYLQLFTHSHLHQQVKIIDKLGFTRIIQLDNFPFLLQYRGNSLEKVLKNLLKEGKIESAKQTISAVLSLYKKEFKKGIYSRDTHVMQHIGFIDKKAFRMDISQLMYKKQMRYPTYYLVELNIVIDQIKKWLAQYYPLYEKEFTLFLMEEYNQFTKI